MNIKKMTTALILVASMAHALAQSTPPNASGTLPQSAPMNAAEQRNLDLVLNWWREVIEARHTELAEKYQAEDYIQHNPNVPTGRAAFVKFFSSLGPATNPIPEKLSHAPVVKGAKGDFVWLVFEQEGKDPHDPSKIVRGNSFEILRIQNGKVQEHWDSARKSPGSPPFVPSTALAPSSWNAGAMSHEEEINLKLATEFSKDILQYGHIELTDQITDPNFIEHNANVPQSRTGFEQFLSHAPDRAPQPIKPEWKTPPVLTIADGPYVVMMWGREDKDPSDPSKVYTRNYFDVLRIQNGFIQEDWN